MDGVPENFIIWINFVCKVIKEAAAQAVSDHDCRMPPIYGGSPVWGKKIIYSIIKGS